MAFKSVVFKFEMFFSRTQTLFSFFVISYEKNRNSRTWGSSRLPGEWQTIRGDPTPNRLLICSRGNLAHITDDDDIIVDESGDDEKRVSHGVGSFKGVPRSTALVKSPPNAAGSRPMGFPSAALASGLSGAAMK